MDKNSMTEEIIKKSYYAIIPADVRYNKKVVDGAKLLYGEVTALCNDKGFCWASNNYFATLYNIEVRTIQRWLASLVKEDFLYIDNSNKVKRKIFLSKKLNIPGLEDEQEYHEPVTEEDPQPKKTEKKPKAKAVVKKEKKYTDDDLFCAELLLSKIIYNTPMFENKKVVISDWADDIRLLREIDKATQEQIIFMITWLQGGEIDVPGKPKKIFPPHEFWAKNILSAGKLRKQWFTLVPQLQDFFRKDHKKTAVAQL